MFTFLEPRIIYRFYILAILDCGAMFLYKNELDFSLFEVNT